MKNSRPYLLRALYDWIVESNCSPYIIVKADDEGVIVPSEFVQDGQIILNISPSAIQNLFINDVAVEFSTRFKGIAKEIYVPMDSVLAIYAKENGQGMIFGPTDNIPSDDSPDTPPKKSSKPNLKIVK